MTIHVERGGLLTTVQDLGRPGHQHEGIPVCGAMDLVALRVANMLVGNPESAAGLEVTLDGPVLRFERAALVAVTGADLSATIGDRVFPPWYVTEVGAGETLRFGEPRAGCRAYVAVSGGIAVPAMLDSRSTYLPAKLGGLNGRALKRGDILPLGEAEVAPSRGPSRVLGARPRGRRLHGSLRDTLRGNADGVVRFVAGPELALLDAPSRDALLGEAYEVSVQSNRMGFRLDGPQLALATPKELISGGVTLGTIQLPPAGQPIVLMADRQTTGGYPRLGEVATVDLSVLAQRRPKDAVRFTEISLEEAQRLYLARERELHSFGIIARLRS